MSNLTEKRLKEKLELRDFKLHALLDVTKAINAQTSERELMQHYVDTLKSNLGIDRLVVRRGLGGCALGFAPGRRHFSDVACPTAGVLL